MNKKANTVVFFLVATLANILILLLVFLTLWILFARFVAPILSEEIIPVFMMVIFFAAIAASFFLYNRLIKFVTVKFKLEERLSPIFGSKKPKD